MKNITWNTIPYALQLIIKLLMELNELLKQKLLLPEKVPKKRGYMKIPEVSEFTNIPESTIRSHIRRGNLISSKPGRSHLVRYEDVIIFMNKYITSVPIEKEIMDEPVDTEKPKRKAKSTTSEVANRTREFLKQQKGRYRNLPPEDYYDSYTEY